MFAFPENNLQATLAYLLHDQLTFVVLLDIFIPPPVFTIKSWTSLGWDALDLLRSLTDRGHNR